MREPRLPGRDGSRLSHAPCAAHNRRLIRRDKTTKGTKDTKGSRFVSFVPFVVDGLAGSSRQRPCIPGSQGLHRPPPPSWPRRPRVSPPETPLPRGLLRVLRVLRALRGFLPPSRPLVTRAHATHDTLDPVITRQVKDAGDSVTPNLFAVLWKRASGPVAGPTI